ncbi:MAG: hypothetical protein Kow0026_27250 [Oricola sp.]
MIRTTTDLPVREFVTLTFAPNGRLRCAAVICAGFIISPDAVLECSAYQEALPHCAFAGMVEQAQSATAVAASMAVPGILVFFKWSDSGPGGRFRRPRYRQLPSFHIRSSACL